MIKNGVSRQSIHGELAKCSVLCANCHQILHSEDRAALYLHYYEDLTFEQAAQVTGEHMTAVRSRIYRALDRLRPGLTQQEDEHANG